MEATNIWLLNWDYYHWAGWVPSKVRDEVEKFWACDLGRSPSQWMNSAERNGAPSLGQYVRCRLFASHAIVLAGDYGGFAEGRYVHAWNNIGRIVKDDGTVACVTCNGWTPLLEEG